MSTGDLPPWPDIHNYQTVVRVRPDIGPIYTSSSSQIEDYERARAEAAIARLRKAVEALRKISAVYRLCWDIEDGKIAIMEKRNVDEFELAHEAVSEALSLIGELPQERT